MKYSRFEELPVWNASADLVPKVFHLTAQAAFSGKRSIADQLERAAFSISNNIAEGFERGSLQELMNFLFIARGSAGEVRSILSILLRMPDFATLKAEIARLKTDAEGISKQLGGWISALRNSDKKGERFVNDKTRALDKRSRERKEFLEQLQNQSRREWDAVPSGAIWSSAIPEMELRGY